MCIAAIGFQNVLKAQFTDGLIEWKPDGAHQVLFSHSSCSINPKMDVVSHSVGQFNPTLAVMANILLDEPQLTFYGLLSGCQWPSHVVCHLEDCIRANLTLLFEATDDGSKSLLKEPSGSLMQMPVIWAHSGEPHSGCLVSKHGCLAPLSHQSRQHVGQKKRGKSRRLFLQRLTLHPTSDPV